MEIIHLKQKKTLKELGESAYSDLPEEILNSTLDTLASIKDDRSSFIDEGGAGSVHKLPGGLCMKFLFDRHTSPHAHMMKLGNTIEQEVSFLERLNHFSVEGVRTPHYFGHINIKNGPKIIIMEELNAVNLQHILNNTADAPNTFHPQSTIAPLEQYIYSLDSLHHIAHQDLEPRNIMIDKVTGMPYVIDFGRSRSLKGLSPAERHTIMDKEDLALEKIYISLRDWFDNQLGGVSDDEKLMRDNLYRRLDIK